MYVICDNLKTLDYGISYRLTLAEALYRFVSSFPGVSSVSVYFDTGSRRRPSDYQYVCTLTGYKLSKFASHNAKKRSRESLSG